MTAVQTRLGNDTGKALSALTRKTLARHLDAKRGDLRPQRTPHEDKALIYQYLEVGCCKCALACAWRVDGPVFAPPQASSMPSWLITPLGLLVCGAGDVAGGAGTVKIPGGVCLVVFCDKRHMQWRSWGRGKEPISAVVMQDIAQCFVRTRRECAARSW